MSRSLFFNLKKIFLCKKNKTNKTIPVIDAFIVNITDKKIDKTNDFKAVGFFT